MFKWEIKGVVGRGMVGGGLVVGRVEWFWKKCYTLCYPKISTNKYVKAFFKPATGGNVFFDFLKLKMKRTFVLSCTDQNSFAQCTVLLYDIPAYTVDHPYIWLEWSIIFPFPIIVQPKWGVLSGQCIYKYSEHEKGQTLKRQSHESFLYPIFVLVNLHLGLWPQNHAHILIIKFYSYVCNLIAKSCTFEMINPAIVKSSLSYKQYEL